MIDVLIVDDEKTIREGIRNNINWEENGINICGTASSGMEALEMINSFMPGIVVTDINMGDMNGLELLEIINQTYPTIKVILISGYKEFEYARKAVTLKAYSYLTKPIDSKALLEKVIQAKVEIEKKISEIKIDNVIKKKLKENILVVRDSFFSSLLEGKLRNSEDIKNQAEFLDINLDYNRFLVAILAFEPGGSLGKRSFYDISFYKAAIMSKTEEKLSEVYSCHVFNLGQKIGVVVCADSIEKSILIQSLETVKIWVNNNMGLSLLIGVGSTCGRIGRISLSYRAASDALEYGVVLGKNMVIDVDAIAETTKEKIAIDDFDSILETSEEQLIIAIKNSDRERVREMTKEIINSVNLVVRNDIKQKDRVIFMLSYYLIKMLFSLEIQNHNYSGRENDLFTHMNSLTGISDISEFIYKFIDGAIDELNKSKKNKNSYLVRQALQIIDNNPDSEVSLVSVAERLQINPSYLSRIFSEEIGESFSEHLIKNKMETGKRLLKTTNKKVYEIADKLGYKDVGYFTKIFKRHFGVSPTEYRNLM